MLKQAKQLLKKETLDVNKLEEEIKDLGAELTRLSSGGGDTNEIKAIGQNLNKKTELVEQVKKLQSLISDYEGALELQNDSEMKEVAEEEIADIEPKLKKLVDEITVASAKPLPNDDKQAIIEIRPGVGGVEASLFAEELFRSYVRYCNSHNLGVEHISLDYDQEGGIKEAIFALNSPGAFGEIRFESGVHRVQRVPVTESGGRIHTSTASIAIIPQFEAKDIEIEDKDLKIDVYRSSGPGGQSVNTTDSAVRITHIPTGIVVTCQSGKSQHQNKETAMKVLISKLQEIEEKEKLEKEMDMRSKAIMSGDRSAKIRTYNFPQGRITDHRINKSWFNIDVVMNGELDEIVKDVSKGLREELEEK